MIPDDDLRDSWRPDDLVRHDRAISRKLRRRRAQFGWATLLVVSLAVAAAFLWFLLTR